MLLPLVLIVIVALTLETGRVHLRGNTYLTATSIILVVGMLGGHVMGNGRRSYPFDTWRMYTTPHAPREYFLFHLVSRDGRTLDYPFHALAPWSPGPMRDFSMLAPITWRLVDRQRRCACSADDPVLDQLLWALVRFAEGRSGIEIVRFDILRVATPPAAGTTPARIYVWQSPPDRRRE